MISWARDRGFKVIPVPGLVRDVHPLKDMRALIHLIGIMRRGRYDIVHCHTSKAGFLGRMAAALCGARAILYSPHGTILDGYFSPAATQCFIWLDRFAARFTDRIVSLTRREIEQYLAVGIGRPAQHTYIYNGIDVDAFARRRVDRREKRRELGIPESCFLCVTVGRLVPVKGQRYLISTLIALPPSGNGGGEVELLIVGDGPLRGELEAQAAHLGLGGRVIFAGQRDDVAEILSAADLFVLPSLHEGLGLALVEAMAMSKPVVATKVGGVPEVVEDGITGLLVPPKNTGALAAAIYRLRDDAETRARMGEAGARPRPLPLLHPTDGGGDGKAVR